MGGGIGSPVPLSIRLLSLLLISMLSTSLTLDADTTAWLSPRRTVTLSQGRTPLHYAADDGDHLVAIFKVCCLVLGGDEGRGWLAGVRVRIRLDVWI